MIKYLWFFIVSVFGHGRLTSPIPRIKNVEGGINAPVYTCLGPAFKTTQTSMRCHDTPAGSIVGTYTSGSVINLEWLMEAPHPGDCSIWLSYDTNVNSPANWIKLKDIPGCLSPNGIDAPSGINRYSLTLPEFLPSCEHCVLRWEWYAVQQVSNVEFYVNCVDIKIISTNTCDIPGPTTIINGIEHLLYNLNDVNQKGCPFYNVYDINIRPPLETRSRGPKEWIPVCNNIFPTPVPTQPPVITYPCDNIDCGMFGSCSNGICTCKNGYTGKNCEIKPIVSCNINCKTLNRNNCQINDVCGNCISGFIGDNNSNTLCKIQCNINCGSLNRKSCIQPNVCGVCLPGFTEPTSMKSSDRCLPSSNINGIKLSISSKWNKGFCGRWITTCPTNREISFNIPTELTDVRGWSLLNMQKIDNKIIGSCPNWVKTGNKAVGGFCASFLPGKNILINNDGYYFENSLKGRQLQEITSIDETYHNVSVTLNLITSEYNLNYESIMNDLETTLYGLSDVTILDYENSELSLKINCKNRKEFDNALFFHSDNIGDIPVDLDIFYKEPINDEGDDKINSSHKLKVTFSLFLNVIIMYLLN